MNDPIDIDKLLKENRAKVLAELKQQEHSLGNGLSHIVAEIGAMAEHQKVLLRRVDELDRHTSRVSSEIGSLRVSIAGDSDLGVRGLGHRVRIVEENSEKIVVKIDNTNKRIDDFESKTKGGLWVVSALATALATIGGLVGTFLGLWIKSFKGG